MKLCFCLLQHPSDESQSTERNTRRSTQRRAQCSGNELQEVAQASGEDLALHPMDAEAGRNTTSHAFQSEHCRSTPFTQLKTTFSASTNQSCKTAVFINVLKDSIEIKLQYRWEAHAQDSDLKPS